MAHFHVCRRCFDPGCFKYSHVFANRAAQQKADELRQERYEEFKERYF